MDTSTDDYDDTFPFSPEPSIESDGFDMDQPQDFIPGTTAPKRYMITTMAAVKSVVIGIGDDSYEALNGTTEGVEVTRESDLSLTVTLSDAFFAGRPGGSHPVSIRVTDSAGAEATAISEYRLQGLLPIEKTDYDLWTNSLTLRALVLDPNVTTATFGLRVKDGEWSDAEGVNAGEGIYTATFTAQWKESVNAAGLTVHTPVAGTGVFAGNSYEARAALDGETVSWARASGRCRAGHPRRGYGKRIAPLFRQKHVGIHDVLGQRQCRNFGTVCAVDQTRHGRQLLRQARIAVGRSACSPRAISSRQRSVLRVSRERPVSECPTSGQRVRRPCGSNTTPPWAPSIRELVTEEHEYIQDGQDRWRIFAVIVDWNSRHATVAGMGSPTGVLGPRQNRRNRRRPRHGLRIAADRRNHTRRRDDDRGDSDRILRQNDRKPPGAYTLVISCTTSAYGDFKVGCLGNVMYVDDFEWVY